MLAFGTIRANQNGFPRNIVLTSAMERRMDRGDYICRNHENLVAMAWYDRRSVYLISTIHPPESIGEPTTVQRRSAGGAWQPLVPQHNVPTRNLWMELLWQTRFSRDFLSYESPTKPRKKSIMGWKCVS